MKAPKIVRWRLAIQEYDFSIRHIKGTSNKIADYLSRVPQLAEVKRIQEMRDDGSDSEACIQSMPNEVPYVLVGQPAPPLEPHPDDVAAYKAATRPAGSPPAEAGSPTHSREPKRRRRTTNDGNDSEYEMDQDSSSSDDYDFVEKESHEPLDVPDPTPQVKLLQLLPADQDVELVQDDEVLMVWFS